MSILKIYRGRVLQAALAEITRPVQVIYVATDQPEPVTVQALADLMKSTPNLLVDFRQDALGDVDRVIVQAEAKPTLVFVGPPLGTELAALISAIIVAGRGKSGLSPTTLGGLADLSRPVHITVFTTPTWPNCAQVVSLAHKFAVESPLITAEAISAVALPELAQAYNILRTPYTVLNDGLHLVGWVQEAQLLAAVRSVAAETIGGSPPTE